jgi:glycosyltransferase involved in cell wall biosynthesis
MSEDALVSCLMVTTATRRRLDYFKQGLAGYCRQTYPNTELVVVVDGAVADGRDATLQLIAGSGRADIRVIEPVAGLSLGALRNVSLRQARGAVVCHWDDDDLHHPQRVERQLEAMTRRRASSIYLEEVMQFFPAERRLYWTNWRATEPGALPATMMCRANAPIAYPEHGPTSRLGEDTAVVEQLQRAGIYEVMDRAPHLYVYVSHGENTYSQDHHRMLASSLAVSQGLLRRHEAWLREGLAAFDFGDGEVTVQGSNGPGFTIQGRGTTAG